MILFSSTLLTAILAVDLMDVLATNASETIAVDSIELVWFAMRSYP